MKSVICLFVRIPEALVFLLSFLSFRNLIEVFLNLISQKWWLLVAALVTIDNENNNVLNMWVSQILWMLLRHVPPVLFHFVELEL